MIDSSILIALLFLIRIASPFRQQASSARLLRLGESCPSHVKGFPFFRLEVGQVWWLIDFTFSFLVIQPNYQYRG